MRIGVDVDGVLRDWDDAFMNLIRRIHPDKIKKDMPSFWNLSHIDLPVDYLRHLFSVEYVNEVYLNAQSIDGSSDQFHMLQTFCSHHNHQLVCVSHQWDGTLTATLQWLGIHGYDFSELHFTKDKWKIDVDVLIDDSPSNYNDWISHHRDESKYILFNRPYNVDCPASSRIDKLTDAIRFIK